MHHGLHGDLIGHVFPGVAFLLLAGLWAADMLRRGAGDANAVFDPRAVAPGAPPLPGASALEGWLKLLLPVLGMLGDARWMTFPMTDANVSDYQHFAAYVMVSLCGATDILVRRGALPRGSNRLTLALMFVVAAFTLAFHGHHMVVVQAVHAELAAALFTVGALVLLEQFHPAPMVRWMQIYALIVSATWFVQVGWMLYVAQYDLMSDDVAVHGHLFYACHLVAAAVVVLAIVGFATKPAPAPTGGT